MFTEQQPSKRLNGLCSSRTNRLRATMASSATGDPFIHAAREFRVEPGWQGQQRPARWLRDVLQPQHGQRGVRQLPEVSRPTRTTRHQDGRERGGQLRWRCRPQLQDTASEATLATRASSVSTSRRWTPQSGSRSRRRTASASRTRAGSPATRCWTWPTSDRAGRDLVSRVNTNAVPGGCAAAAAAIGNADLNKPRPSRRPRRRGNQHLPSLPAQPGDHGVRLRRRVELQLDAAHAEQADRAGRLQYFVTYTLSKTEGHARNDEYRNRDPFNPSRTSVSRSEDRTHIFNVSWNAYLPDPIREGGNPVLGQALAQRLAALRAFRQSRAGSRSGSGSADRLAAATRTQGYYGTPDSRVAHGPGQPVHRRGLAPVYTCDPRRRAEPSLVRSSSTSTASRVPGLRRSGRGPAAVRPADGRCGRNHDITLFKNFDLPRDQRLQFRVGVFNMFNRPSATTAVDRNDIDLKLDRTCNRVRQRRLQRGRRHGRRGVRPDRRVPFTQNHQQLRPDQPARGQRVVEFALKYDF